MKGPLSVRRQFVGLLALAAAGLSVAGLQLGARQVQAKAPSTLVQFARRCRRILQVPLALEALGEAHPEHSGSNSLEQLAADLGLTEPGFEQAVRWTDAELLLHLRSRIESDFASERWVSVSGWLMSRTEAALCLLLYQLRAD